MPTHSGRHFYISNLDNRMKKHLHWMLSLVAATAFSAQAQDTYLGIETGLAHADTKVDETAQEIANAVGETVYYTYNPVTAAFRVYGGHRVDPLLRLELGYLRTANLTATYRFVGGSATESYSASGLDASVLINPEGSGLFARLGLHATELNASATVYYNGYLGAIGLKRSGTGMLLGLGYEQERDTQNAIRYGWTRYMGVGGVSGADVDLISAAWMIKF
jgi:hypothetical protein